MALSHGKCWYCEARQMRSDNAVDHFRPKSRYPWRAFSKDNFRFACTFCNSRRTNPQTGETEGKGDFFPLVEGSQRATREEDIDAEQPVLLDPCVAADCSLLDFRSDGIPCPARSDQPVTVKRVSDSITFYHLDHPALTEERRVLALKISKAVKAANPLYPRAQAGVEPELARAFGEFVEIIARSIDDRAELSAFARRMLKTHRAIPWVEELLYI
jgi:uncharacterized protein (TIGR02646 family)